jgi:GT2 family glycosyltransferase
MEYVTGCAILVKRAVIATAGLLDTRFFMYFEESEWCARARRAGFRVVYVPQGRLWHKIKMEARNSSRRYLYLMARNRLLYLRCIGASRWNIVVAALDLLRLAAVWSLRSRHRDKRGLADALVLGVGAFVIGRFGEAPASI